jgi:nicotinamide-nucleotide amidase
MDASIIAVGSEMLGAERLDTNSLYLTDHLNTLGVEVISKLVVGDHRPRLVDAMRYALSRAPILILSGGLGPTEDDLTRDAVAELVDRPLVFQQEVYAAIEERFRRMKRVMAEVNRRQAYVVEGASILPNARGTAPGQWLEWNGAHIVMLPGPPHELKHVFESHCLTRLGHIVPPLVIRKRCYRVAGMGESDLDQLIAPVYRNYANPATTILAAAGDIQIHLRARCQAQEEAEALLDELAGPIRQLLGDRIYTETGEPLEATVGALLARRGMTLAVAESCTGGMLAERITSVPGASAYFMGGFLVYTYAAKISLLGIDPALLESERAASESVARAMAEAARRKTGASLALSVTGVAGPSQGEEKEPVGAVFIGVADESGGCARRFQFAGDRDRIRTLATQTALDILRRRLMAT